MGIMSLSEIMDKSVDIVRRYFKTIILYSLGYGVIMFIGIILGLILMGILAAAAATTGSTVVAAVFVGLVVIVIAPISMSYHAGLIKIAAQDYTGERVDTYKAVGSAFKSILKIMGLVVVAMLMLLPLVGLYFLGSALFSIGADSLHDLIELFWARDIVIIITVIIILALGFLVIMTYFTWLAFSLHAIILEKKGVFGAVKRSFVLVHKNFWRLLGSLVLFYLTVYAINLSFYSFVSIVASAIYLIFKLLSVQQDFLTFLTMAVSLAQWPMNIISWVIVAPIGTSMLTLLYYNQRFKKEGYDMQLRLQSIILKDERKQSSEAVEFSGSTES